MGKLDLWIPKEVRVYVIIMAIATALINLCYVGSINFISVFLAAIIFFTFPIQILLVSIIRGSQNIRTSDIIIFSVVFIGLILLLYLICQHRSAWRPISRIIEYKCNFFVLLSRCCLKKIKSNHL